MVIKSWAIQFLAIWWWWMTYIRKLLGALIQETTNEIICTKGTFSLLGRKPSNFVLIHNDNSEQVTHLQRFSEVDCQQADCPGKQMWTRGDDISLHKTAKLSHLQIWLSHSKHEGVELPTQVTFRSQYLLIIKWLVYGFRDNIFQLIFLINKSFLHCFEGGKHITSCYFSVSFGQQL